MNQVNIVIPSGQVGMKTPNSSYTGSKPLGFVIRSLAKALLKNGKTSIEEPPQCCGEARVSIDTSRSIAGYVSVRTWG